MRWALRCAMVIVMAVGGASGAAAAAGQWTLGAGAGAAVPSGDFGDAMAAGFDGAVFADYWFNDQFALGVDIGGSLHNAKDEFNDDLNAFTEAFLLALGATTVDSQLEVTASILRFGARGTLAVPTAGAVRPYVQAGAGIYRLNTKIEGTVTVDGFAESVDEAEDDSKFGANGAVGVLFQMSPKVSLGAQAQIHNVFTEEESTQYFGFGVVIQFVAGGAY